MNKEHVSNGTLVQNNQHNYFDGTFCSSWIIIMIQTYMYTPASCSERVQLAKWTENVRADLFSLSLLKRQIAFTTGCRTFLFTVVGMEHTAGPDRTTWENAATLSHYKTDNKLHCKVLEEIIHLDITVVPPSSLHFHTEWAYIWSAPSCTPCDDR